MDAADYKHVVLGLIFAEYISNSFEEKMKHLTESLAKQSVEAAKLDQAIWTNLNKLGYGTEGKL